MASNSEITTLTQAFPNLNPSTIQDIYKARGGNIQQAFETLLLISQPQSSSLPPPPPTPPRPQSSYQNQSPSASPQPTYNAQPVYPSPGNGYLQPPAAATTQQYNTSPQQSPSPQLPQPQPVGHAQSYFSNTFQQGNQPPAYSPHPSPGLQPQRPSYSPQPSPQPSPGLHPQRPSYSSQTAQTPSPGLLPHQQSSPYLTGTNVPSHGTNGMPDMGSLSLEESRQQTSHAPKARTKHNAHCDGCGADPIRGIRWRCLKCPNEDLCSDCKEAGVQSSHRFEQVEVHAEQHEHTCDGCPTPDRFVVGPRYACTVHADEDFCEKCVREGRACKGPFKQVRASDLARHLERFCCVPMPNAWVPLLQPPTGEYHNGSADVINSWREMPKKLGLTSTPMRDQADGTSPVIDYEIAVSEHRAKFTWTLTHVPTKKLAWTFKAKIGHRGGLEEVSLTPHHGKAMPLDWQQTGRSEMLCFISSTGAKFRWVTSAPSSNLNGNRMDLARHALFASGPRHSSQETIIADYTDWDGHLEDPEDCLTLRSKDVDPSLIVASHLAVISYQLFVQKREINEHPAEVNETEAIARLTPLGRQSFWYLSDYVDQTANNSGSQTGMSSDEKKKLVTSGLKLLKGSMQLANAVMQAQGGG